MQQQHTTLIMALHIDVTDMSDTQIDLIKATYRAGVPAELQHAIFFDEDTYTPPDVQQMLSRVQQEFKREDSQPPRRRFRGGGKGA